MVSLVDFLIQRIPELSKVKIRSKYMVLYRFLKTKYQTSNAPYWLCYGRYTAYVCYEYILNLNKMN